MRKHEQLEAERALVSGLLQQSSLESVRSVAPMVRVDDFTDSRCKAIFQAIQVIAADGAAVDVVTVVGHLRASGALERIGGAAYLAGLVNACPNMRAVGEYAHSIASAATRRRLLADLGSLRGLVHAGKKTPEEAAQSLQAMVDELAGGFASGSEDTSLGFHAQKLVRQIDGLERPEFGPPIPTGIGIIDDTNDGIRAGSVTVIGARPSVGKSAIGKQIANHLDLSGHGCLIVSHEMEPYEITERLMSERTGINGSMMRPDIDGTYTLSGDEVDLIRQEADKAQQSNLHMIAPVGRRATFPGISAAIRRAKSAHNIEVVIVDYLQLVPKCDSKQATFDHLSEVSKGFKDLARELKIAVIELAQLNRESEKDKTPREPRLSDLRGSGSIEQDADNVCFLWRPDESDNNKVRVTIAKWRGGALDSEDMKFNGSTTSFIAPSVREHPNFHTEFEAYSGHQAF